MDAACKTLTLQAFDYHLPQELIAQFPLENRDQSRMLVLDRATGQMAHHQFFELPSFLKPGDLVVINNTRVLHARLTGKRRGFSGKVGFLLLAPHPTDPEVWSCLMKPARKLKPGTVVELEGGNGAPEATVVIEGHDPDANGKGWVRLNLGTYATAHELMEALGEVPIPPYLNRDPVEADQHTYQTVFAKTPGSQAAPTAGLHFTPEVFDALREKGVQVEEVTLSVSTGTFRNINVEEISQHRMDPEQYHIPPSVAKAIGETRARGGRIVAIGTTVAKTLESSAARHQGVVQAESAWSELFIYPGFNFQVVDVLLTNFHLPRTTLLMLVSAFAGREPVLAAYDEAVRENYRFFSYGDCMLIR
jgi:S-adenosylmethionine:tRNA ribosyltransferase-isomerase